MIAWSRWCKLGKLFSNSLPGLYPLRRYLGGSGVGLSYFKTPMQFQNEANLRTTDLGQLSIQSRNPFFSPAHLKDELSTLYFIWFVVSLGNNQTYYLAASFWIPLIFGFLHLADSCLPKLSICWSVFWLPEHLQTKSNSSTRTQFSCFSHVRSSQ